MKHTDPVSGNKAEHERQREREYRELLEKLQDAEQRWRSITENPFDFVVIVDRDGVFQYINHAAFGLKIEDLIGKKSIFDFTDPENQTTIRATIAEVFRTGRAAAYETYAPPPVDNWYRSIVGPIAKNGVVSSVSILSHEITPRKRVELALRESEERFRQLAEHIQDCFYLLDVATLRILYMSPIAESMFGVPLAACYVDPRAWMRAVHPDDLPVLLERFHDIAGDNFNSGIPTEFRVMVDDMVYWLQHRSFAIRDSDGRLRRTAGIITDITARTEAQVAQRMARAMSLRLVEVQEAERRHIARELHDEIGQTLTWLRLLLGTIGKLDGSERERRLAEADDLVRSLMSHVNDLSLDLRPRILDDLGLRPALLWLFERHKRRSNLLVHFEQHSLDRRFGHDVETTAFRVVQEGLTNVVRHAAVADARVRVWVADEVLNLQVEDRGIGFDVEAMAKEKSCFGLCSMRERVRLHGGDLVVESIPGDGCRITANIPVRNVPSVAFDGGATR